MSNHPFCEETPPNAHPERSEAQRETVCMLQHLFKVLVLKHANENQACAGV